MLPTRQRVLLILLRVLRLRVRHIRAREPVVVPALRVVPAIPGPLVADAVEPVVDSHEANNRVSSQFFNLSNLGMLHVKN